MIAENISNTGNYTWLIPRNLTKGPYGIRITSLSNNDIYASTSLVIEEPKTPGFETTLVLCALLLFVSLSIWMKKKR